MPPRRLCVYAERVAPARGQSVCGETCPSLCRPPRQDPIMRSGGPDHVTDLVDLRPAALARRHDAVAADDDSDRHGCDTQERADLDCGQPGVTSHRGRGYPRGRALGPYPTGRQGARVADVTSAVLYTRISQDRGGEGLGVARQLEDAEQLARLRGWPIVAHHSDNDTSAAGKAPRPGFDAALAAIDSGAATVLVAWSLDRLTRNRKDQLRLVDTCQRAQATIALVRGSDVDMSSAAGRLVADMLSSVARHEIEAKSERQVRAAAQAAAAGRRYGGRRPFGYETDGVTIRDTEATAVRDAYTALLAGRSLAAIARDWNARGLSTPQGRQGRNGGGPAIWTSHVLGRCLAKPRYAGLREYRGKVVGPAAWPPLVDEDVWRAAQAVLRDPSRRTPGGPRFLLTGVALCGVCGSTVHGGGGSRGKVIYRCSGNLGHIARMTAPIDRHVEAVVVARLSRPDAASAFTPARPDVDDARRDADVLRGRLESLALDFAEGALTSAQLRAATALLRARLDTAEQKVATANAGTVLAPLMGATDVLGTWLGLDVDERRAIIDAVATVRVLPVGRGVRTFRRESVEITWKGKP